MMDYGIRGVICASLLCVSAWGGRVSADDEKIVFPEIEIGLPDYSQMETPVSAERESEESAIPDLRIAPGDCLMIEVGKMTPMQPFFLDMREPVWVNVGNLPGDEPVRHFFVNIREGMLGLGAYGSIRVEGMTKEEATDAVTRHMASFAENPEVSLGQAAVDKWRGMSGKYFVSPTGEIDLRSSVRSYNNGKIFVARMTPAEVEAAIRERFAEWQVEAEVTVKQAVIRADRNYYLVHSVFEMSSHEVELAEGATMLDILTDAKVFSWLHEGTKVEISRGSGDKFMTSSSRQDIPVDWKAILQGDLRTNYMLFSDDIVVISPKAMKRANY